MVTLLKGTHNSCTGEKGKGLLSKLITPFAKCQSKTISEQIIEGVTYFDLRIAYDKHDNLIICHGLWKCKKSLNDVVNRIDLYARRIEHKVYVRFMYEKRFKSEAQKLKFIEWFNKFNFRTKFIVTEVWFKKPYLVKYYTNKKAVPYEEAFVGLPVVKGRWEWLLPIPYLWYKIKGKVKFDKDKYKLIDFI